VGAKLFCGDERMDIEDITKQLAAFCTFANMPKSFDYIAVWKLDTTADLT
jgi:hypothetical protein